MTTITFETGPLELLSGIRGPAAHPARPAAPRRARRMARLLLAVVVLSVVDLLVTLGFMATMGMYEANPITVLLVRATNSAIAVTVYKLVSIAIAVSLLHALRHHWQAEVGAWVAVVVLALLAAQWVRYARVMSELDSQAMALMDDDDPGWVVLD